MGTRGVIEMTKPIQTIYACRHTQGFTSATAASEGAEYLHGFDKSVEIWSIVSQCQC